MQMIVSSIFISGISGLILSGVYMQYVYTPKIFQLSGFLFLIGLIYVAITFIFINVVFGIGVTSIRIQLLLEIASFGLRGISRTALMNKYDKKKIINNRLDRLISSGIIINQNNTLSLSNNFSLFNLYTTLIGIIMKIYNINNKLSA